jgi:NADH-quinone oxidoreductase subunit A
MAMEQYLPIAIILVLAVVFAAGMVATPMILGPRRATAAKEGPYESGIVPRRGPAARYPVRFYLVAMIFIIFDIEVVFIYPWAVMYRELSTFGLAEMGTFAGIVFISFAYLVSNGALDWGPDQEQHNRPGVDLTRTTTATVRHVPRPEQVAFDGPALRPANEYDADGVAIDPSAPVPVGVGPESETGSE